ncbi:tetratricopeptide repeat protein [bacterium]|nr:tetratricopeptide repeat protein [bacterium]
MADLTISTLGSFSIMRNGEPIPLDAWRTRKNLELVQILLTLHRRSVTQDELMEWLWPDLAPARAGRNLRVAVSQARRTLEPHLKKGGDSSYLITQATGYRWYAPPGCTVDAETFEHGIASLRQGNPSLSPVDFAARAQPVLDLYQGDYLPEFRYAEWGAPRRRRLQTDFLWLVNHLIAQHVEREAFTTALDLCRRSLTVDNCQELIWRRLIFCLWRAGDSATALRAYADCQETLARELDIAPEAETVALADEIRRSTAQSAPRSPSRPTSLSSVYPLPRALTPLISREDEIALVLDRLRRSDCRLLTLIGAGGIGKTRLAVTCARRLAEDGPFRDGLFRDGIVFVDLAPVTEGDPLLSTLAAAVHAPIQGNRSWLAELTDFLAERNMLLVLDNFEQLTAQAHLLLELLAHTSQLKLMVTSREPLYAHGEWLVEVGPLAYPTEDERGDPGVYAALDLFLAGAQRIRPNFGDDPTQIDNAAAICRLVEGNPLAIELAASLVRRYSSAEIDAGIRRSHHFLDSRLSGLPDRHRSLAALFDHSWHLLSPEEQRGLARLAVFRGGWDGPAAFAVTAPADHLLDMLADRLLIRAADENRYQMHELLRQFADERLAADADAARDAQTRHCTYFADYIRRQGQALKGTNQPNGLRRIQVDLANARAAWRWALAQHSWADLAGLAEGLFEFYRVRSWFQEGADLLAEAKPSDLHGSIADDHAGMLAVVLARLGNLYVHLSDFDRARTLLDEALTLARRLHVHADAALALIGLGTAAQQQGRYAEAERFYLDAQQAYQQAADPWGQAQSLNALGVVAARTGRFDDAETFYSESIECYAAIGDRWSMTQPTNNLAILSYTRRNYSQAQMLFAHNLPIFQEIGDAKGEALTLSNLGTLARDQDDPHTAQDYYLRSLDLFAAIGNRWAVANAHTNLGVVALAMGLLLDAQTQFEQALILAHKLHAEPMLLYVIVGCAQLFAAQGDPTHARVLLDYALAHPALKAETRQLAESVREELPLSVPPSTENSFPIAAHLPLSTVVEHLLNEFAL